MVISYFPFVLRQINFQEKFGSIEKKREFGYIELYEKGDGEQYKSTSFITTSVTP